MLTMRERIEMSLGAGTDLVVTAPHLMAAARENLSRFEPDEGSRSRSRSGRSTSRPRIHLDARGLSSTVPVLFLRSTLVPSPELSRVLREAGPGTLLLVEGDIAGFILPPLQKKIPLWRLFPPDRNLMPDRSVLEELAGGPPIGVGARRLRDADAHALVLDAAWECVRENAALLTRDFELLSASRGRASRRAVPAGVSAAGKGGIWIAKGAEVRPHVFLDATGGPIFIEEGARILPFTSIEGPAFVGKGSTLIGALVRSGTSIGPVCKVGGEIDCTIFQGHANKAHSGFIGHSFVGEWVNLGAGTTNSDLKNTYGPVRITSGGRVYETGMLKIGALVGDHVKTGIGTLIDTGAVLGTGANVFGGGIQPKYIPPFVWGGGGRFEEYRLDAFMKTAELVMARRGGSLTVHLRQVLQEIHGMSSAERREWLARRAGSGAAPQ
jgi:UDP-N-acetylglucosamine diphosphorylase/glucosamine-1-phosphate N-acetyltransferase